MENAERSDDLPMRTALGGCYGVLMVCGLALQLDPTGLRFAPSAAARWGAVLWSIVGGLACARLWAFWRDRLLLARLALIGAACLTQYCLWCAWPEPVDVRAGRLLSSAQPDRTTFRVLTAETLARPVDARTLLALAAYRAARLEEPAAGLTVRAIGAEGFLTFASLSVVARIDGGLVELFDGGSSLPFLLPNLTPSSPCFWFT